MGAPDVWIVTIPLAVEIIRPVWAVVRGGPARETARTYMTFTQSAHFIIPGRSKCCKYQYDDGAVLQ